LSDVDVASHDSGQSIVPSVLTMRPPSEAVTFSVRVRRGSVSKSAPRSPVAVGANLHDPSGCASAAHSPVHSRGLDGGCAEEVARRRRIGRC
jgi:hypothetical protein